ncbi:hypothetical protein VQH23_07045 [Pararoseomonas sp. SCSIO 73927]|uniref:hypothetical protein n=1 Tax=Pararoseomonas sp. SCSIO 73927 TaxID=3114537 RepID=UPI0030CD631C
MPNQEDRLDEAVRTAVELARDVADGLDAVLLTHFADADALDTLRPGETDPETVRAVNRAVAAEMLAAGVEVFVQRADRGAFRRWMQGRVDTPESRRAWIDRDRLLRGDAALGLLGLGPAGSPPPEPRPGGQPGPAADRLLAAFVAGDEDELDALAQDLLSAGRAEVLDLAIRKAAERHGNGNAEELAATLLSVAAGGALGPSGWAELVALPVALPPGGLPDAAAIAEGLLASGALEEALEVRFLPGWRAPKILAGLSPGALRRALLDMVAGEEPRDLPPGDAEGLLAGGFGVLVGLEIDWDIPVWDEIAAQGGLPLPAGEDEERMTPEESRAAALFDGWRGAVFEASGCVPLALVPLPETEAEIAEFLDEAGAGTPGLEEIVAFIAGARQVAGEEEVVCRLEFVGDALEMSLFTAGGQFLDSLTLPPERMPAKAVDMPAIIAGFVRLVRDAPGR